jgi:ligand-binding sensor domain-containing protein
MSGSTIGSKSGAPVASLRWEAVGSWQAGTVAGVALLQFNGTGTEGTLAGLLASRAGVYGWRDPDSKVAPLMAGLSDPNVVAVAFAGGDGTTPALALASTASGRLFRGMADIDAQEGDAQERDAWQEITGWAGLGIALVLAPSPAFAEDRTLFTGTPAGIFRTQDLGASWESCNFGLLDEDVLSMVCAPTFAQSELLWAGTAGGGLYRSRNSGRAWRESGMGLPDAAVQSLAVSPNFAQDQTLFAGLEAHGVYLSRDGGANWSSLGLDGLSVNSLACSRAGTLWAATEDGLWRVATGTGEVTQVAGAGETVMSVAASAEGQLALGLYGAGLWLTADANREPHLIEWQKPHVALHAPPIVATAGEEIFALDSDGLLARSTVASPEVAAQWQEMESAGLGDLYALAGASDGTLIAAAGTGLARWLGESGGWQEITSPIFATHYALGIELSPRFGNDHTLNDNTLLVVAHDGALLLSRDGGVQWDNITGPWQGQSLLQARFAPDDANSIAAVTVQPNETGHFAVAVWQSQDQGQTWEVLAGLTSGVPAVMMAWPSDEVENAIFLATQHRVIKLFHPGDDPAALEVYQHFFDEHLRVTTLAVAPDYRQSKQVWAATSSGLYRSTDGGTSWEFMAHLPHELPIVWLEVTLEVSGQSIHAVTLGGYAWRAALSES